MLCIDLHTAMTNRKRKRKRGRTVRGRARTARQAKTTLKKKKRAGVFRRNRRIKHACRNSTGAESSQHTRARKDHFKSRSERSPRRNFVQEHLDTLASAGSCLYVLTAEKGLKRNTSENTYIGVPCVSI